jgi:hypothetical protein
MAFRARAHFLVLLLLAPLPAWSEHTSLGPKQQQSRRLLQSTWSASATGVNCLTYTTLSPPGFCGATTTLAACEAVCTSTSGCTAIKWAYAMNAVASSCPNGGAGYSWCMLLSSFSSCDYTGDIWQMFYQISSLPSPPPRPIPPQPPFPPSPPPLPGRPAFACAAGNDPVVCSALGDLYYATNGAGWGNKSGWLSAATGTPTDYCSFWQSPAPAGSPLDACFPSGVLTRMCVGKVSCELHLQTIIRCALLPAILIATA